jgi:hypothetical protein
VTFKLRLEVSLRKYRVKFRSVDRYREAEGKHL